MGDLNEIERKRKIGNLDSPKNPFDYYDREYGTVPRDTKRAPFQWVSEVAYKNVHRIVSRGYDTTELMEEGYGVVDMLFVDYQARIPTIEEEKIILADLKVRHKIIKEKFKVEIEKCTSINENIAECTE